MCHGVDQRCDLDQIAITYFFPGTGVAPKHDSFFFRSRVLVIHKVEVQHRIEQNIGVENLSFKHHGRSQEGPF